MSAQIKSPCNAGNTARAKSEKDRSHYTANPIDLILGRINSVKQTAPSKWQAKCPAHDDRSPSLSIRETGDGTVLMRCWAGCGAEAIVRAVGLELRDLFPPRFNADGKPARVPRFNAADVVKTVITESTILTLGYRAMQGGDTLEAEDSARVEVAIQAIQNCREVVCH